MIGSVPNIDCQIMRAYTDYVLSCAGNVPLKSQTPTNTDNAANKPKTTKQKIIKAAKITAAVAGAILLGKTIFKHLPKTGATGPKTPVIQKIKTFATNLWNSVSPKIKNAGGAIKNFVGNIFKKKKP